jgi:hypothetical protein
MGWLTVFRPTVNGILGKPKTRPFRAPESVADHTMGSDIFVSIASATDVRAYCSSLVCVPSETRRSPPPHPRTEIRHDQLRGSNGFCSVFVSIGQHEPILVDGSCHKSTPAQHFLPVSFVP